MLDYRDTACVAAVFKHLANTVDHVRYSYMEFDFEQSDLPWSFYKIQGGRASKVEVSSGCTFIASVAVARFYKNPQGFMACWSNAEQWRDIQEEGLRLHEVYCRRCILGVEGLEAALAAEAFYVTPAEYAAKLDELVEVDTAFAELRALYADRALVALTDPCTLCGSTCHSVALSGDARCSQCGGHMAVGKNHDHG
jgi:hypothetical protein